MDGGILGLVGPVAVALCAGSATTLLVVQRRLGREHGSLPFAAVTNCFVGSIVALLMIVHCVAVVLVWLQTREGHWVAGEPHVMINGVPWDFRIYGLLLFGAIGVGCGVASVMAGSGMAS